MGFIKSLIEDQVDRVEAKRFESLRLGLHNEVSVLETRLVESEETLQSIKAEMEEQQKENQEAFDESQKKLLRLKGTLTPVVKILSSEDSLAEQIEASLASQVKAKKDIDYWAERAQLEKEEELEVRPVRENPRSPATRDHENYKYYELCSQLSTGKRPELQSEEAIEAKFQKHARLPKQRIKEEMEMQKDLQALTVLFEGESGVSRLVSMLEDVKDTNREAKSFQGELEYLLCKLNGEPADELEALDDLGERMKRLGAMG
jgi:hypothetical protein